MQKLLILLMLTIFMFILGAYAHPPSDIKIAFDKNTKTFQAEIIHNVSNPLKHYINKVDIWLNNKEIIEHKISQQDDSISQKVLYFIPDAKENDVISVEAYCSITGKLKKDIIVK